MTSKVERMMDRKVDLSALPQAGTYPDTDEKLVLELAIAIHYNESDGAAVSWSAQVRAQDFYNEHGLAKSLDELFRLQALNKGK
jgi:predicted GNAT family N-acyltransferase